MCIFMKEVTIVVNAFGPSLAVNFQPHIIAQQDMNCTSSLILITTQSGLDFYMSGVSVFYVIVFVGACRHWPQYENV